MAKTFEGFMESDFRNSFTDIGLKLRYDLTDGGMKFENLSLRADMEEADSIKQLMNAHRGDQGFKLSMNNRFSLFANKPTQPTQDTTPENDDQNTSKFN